MMLIKQSSFIISLIVCLTIFSCTSDDYYTPIPEPQEIEPEEISPVIFDIAEVPYQTLSDYNFFDGDLKDLSPVYGVLPYDLNSSLFSDYAKKKRFVWMPDDVSAAYVNDYSPLNFPIGTVLIKNFYYNNVQPANDTRIIETRLMINKADGWIFANYIWNDDQSEAIFSLEGGLTDIEWIENGVPKSTTYKIPPESECFTCHKIAAIPMPIGPKPQNLNKDHAFSDGVFNQLEKLKEFGYLNGSIPTDINTVIDWQDDSQSIDLRMRSYMDVNCAHCHSEDAHCHYRPVRFAFNENDDEINLGACVEPEEQFGGLTYIVSPGNINRSMLHFRLSTTLAQRRMPLLGRNLVHEEAVEMVEEWINSLTTICN